MISPATPLIMWAAHDEVLDRFSFPYASHQEARLMRNAALAHLPERERDRQFPILPVIVTLTPGPIAALPQPHQARLFDSEDRHGTRPDHA